MALLFFLIAFLASPVMSKHAQFFRKDYTYLSNFDAFYKMHLDIEGFSWNKAFMSCENEGAKLFYPQTTGEWTVAKTLLESTNRSIVFAIVGIRDEYGMNDFITDEGKPTQIQINTINDGREAQCVLMNIDSGDYIAESCSRTSERTLAYICKKVEEEACPTIDKGYQYSKAARKCYKVNNKARSWPEAWRTCIMEGGSLAVVTDSAQANVLKELIGSGNQHFVGFRKMVPFEAFYSVKGNLVDDEYPLNWYSEPNYICGMYYNQNNELYRKSTNCGDAYSFICEMELDTLN